MDSEELDTYQGINEDQSSSSQDGNDHDNDVLALTRHETPHSFQMMQPSFNILLE
jgi:hypothetical protein